MKIFRCLLCLVLMKEAVFLSHHKIRKRRFAKLPRKNFFPLEGISDNKSRKVISLLKRTSRISKGMAKDIFSNCRVNLTKKAATSNNCALAKSRRCSAVARPQEITSKCLKIDRLVFWNLYKLKVF